jgi:hypothetical protein
VKARYYDAKLGRFTSRGPIYSENLYAYTHNNPVNNTDQNGMLQQGVDGEYGVPKQGGGWREGSNSGKTMHTPSKKTHSSRGTPSRNSRTKNSSKTAKSKTNSGTAVGKMVSAVGGGIVGNQLDDALEYGITKNLTKFGVKEPGARILAGASVFGGLVWGL